PRDLGLTADAGPWAAADASRPSRTRREYVHVGRSAPSMAPIVRDGPDASTAPEFLGGGQEGPLGALSDFMELPDLAPAVPERVSAARRLPAGDGPHALLDTPRPDRPRDRRGTVHFARFPARHGTEAGALHQPRRVEHAPPGRRLESADR